MSKLCSPVQMLKGKAKPYQIDQFLKLVERNNLKLDVDISTESEKESSTPG